MDRQSGIWTTDQQLGGFLCAVYCYFNVNVNIIYEMERDVRPLCVLLQIKGNHFCSEALRITYLLLQLC